VVATILHPGSAAAVGMSLERIGHLGELAGQWLREGNVQTMVLLVARRGQIVFHRAFGPLTPDPGASPTPLDAIFPTASVGKVITATAVMLLVEEGLVGLNRPVSGYLPEFQGEGKDAVLVRHLLTHTSGLRGEDVERFVTQSRGELEIPPATGSLHPLLNEYFARRYRCPLWKPPGVEMSYLPYGFELLGEIVRRVSAEPLDRFARDRIFRPLGMDDSSYCPVDVAPQRRVRRAPEPDLPTDATDLAHETERLYWGSGGVETTAHDLAVFGQMFLNRGRYGDARILSPAGVAAMTRNQIPGIGAEFYGQVFPEASFGYGWSVHGDKTGMCGGLYSARAFEHWGRGGSYFWVDPDLAIVGVYLSATAWSLDTVVHWFRYNRADLFQDAVTAAVSEP